MKQTKALRSTPSPANRSENQNQVGHKNAIRMMFVGAVLDLTWQMAIVVLVPIIGGYELDKALKTSPALIIIGFVLAMAGTFLVLRRTLNRYSDQAGPKEKS